MGNETQTQVPVLQAMHIEAGYGRRRVLTDVSFALEGGTLTALLGANGCGKTTLLKVLCRQLPYAGDCMLTGQALHTLSVRELARQISYIPQRTGIAISLPVLDVVLMGFNPVLGILEHPSKQQRQQALEALRTVGMDACAEQDYLTLSEGQKQLCILARAMIEHSVLLLLDEPESALDFPHRHAMMRLLCQMIEGTDKAALISLHDPSLALNYCRQILLLKDGVCIGSLRPDKNPLSDMQRVLSAIYGPVHLTAVGENGTRQLVMLPAENENGGYYAAHNPYFSARR